MAAETATSSYGAAGEATTPSMTGMRRKAESPATYGL
jgi:hypothetical protein